MAISYLLAPIPKWVIMNNEGEAAGGAKLYTYRSRNKVQQKPVYQDAGGVLTWTNPILFDANGTQGPFYWKVDSADLGDTYYLEAYDSNDVLLWTVDDFFPPGSGGGGNTTTYVPLNNFISNNVFIDHIDDTANPTNTTNLKIAPSNHAFFTPDYSVPVVGTNGVVGPDIRFVKNNTAATDQITFVTFSLSDGPLTADVTPVQYLRYECTNSPAGETYKSFQFPICQKVKNLAGKEMTFRIWMKCAAGTETVTLYTRQYFGSGGAPSAEVRTSQGTISLTTTWTHATIQFIVPSVTGKTLGSCGDDALYLQLEMPLGEPCDIWFTKPALYLGTIDPDSDFDTYDQINSITQTPRTGDIKPSFLGSSPQGWIALNDGSIGSVASAATTRANIDTFFLFKTIWDAVSNTYAPTQDNTGTPVARGASAVADFAADRRIVLPRSLGRVLGGAGAGSGLTARSDGEWLGAETHLIDANELPAHTHAAPPGNFITGVVGGIFGVGALGSLAAATGVNTTLANPMTIMQPTLFANMFIKL